MIIIKNQKNSNLNNTNNLNFNFVDHNFNRYDLLDQQKGFTYIKNKSDSMDCSDLFHDQYDRFDILNNKQEIENMKKILKCLIDFLIMKGIISSKEEFDDFIDSVDLLDKLSENND